MAIIFTRVNSDMVFPEQSKLSLELYNSCLPVNFVQINMSLQYHHNVYYYFQQGHSWHLMLLIFISPETTNKCVSELSKMHRQKALKYQTSQFFFFKLKFLLIHNEKKISIHTREPRCYKLMHINRNVMAWFPPPQFRLFDKTEGRSFLFLNIFSQFRNQAVSTCSWRLLSWTHKFS